MLPLSALAFLGYVIHAGFASDVLETKAAAGVNKMISYQAKMTDNLGAVVSDGTYWLTLRIYDSASGGTCLYTASGTSCGAATSTPVTVASGMFSIMIGDTASQNALTLDFNSDTYYLGVQINNDSEMTPRKRIGASGYAINSDTLDGYNTSLTGGSSSFVPVTNSSGDLFLTQRFLTSSTIYASGSGTSTFSYGATFATSGGNVGIGTSAPLNTLDIYIASGFNPTFVLRDGDMANPFTSFNNPIPTNAIGGLAPIHSTLGGLEVDGYTDGNAVPLMLRGFIGVIDPTDTIPAILLRGGKFDGVDNATSLASTETLLRLDNLYT